MINGTAVVVDSASYLPATVRERYGIIRVPLSVTIDGEDYLEFETIDSPAFYARLAAGAQVATSQPSPGDFVEAYEAAKERGAQNIVSIHIGSALSGTVNSARIAADLVDVPVTVVDTFQASFIEGLCAWEACEALEQGAGIPEASMRAVEAGERCGNVFIVKGTELLRAGGRMSAGADADADAGPGVPVLALGPGGIRPIGSAATVGEAMDAMMGHFEAAVAAHPGSAFRVGIANGAADGLAAELEARVRAVPAATEVMQYEIGPAVGAHTGPGCTGIVFLPRPPQ